jgi:hypothetical protein
MTTPAASVDTAPAAPAKPAALWEDFVDIFTQPRAVFERRRDGRFGLALVILTAISAAIFFGTRPLTQPLLDRVMAYGMAQQVRQGAMTAEQAAQAQQMMGGFSNVLAAAGALFTVPMIVLLSAALLWVGGKVAGARLAFAQAMTVATYANVPRVIVGGVLGALLLANTDVERLPPMTQAAPLGPAFALGADANPVLVMLAQRFDATTLWATVLAGVGVAVMARTGRSRGLAATAVAWGAATLYALYQGWKYTL